MRNETCAVTFPGITVESRQVYRSVLEMLCMPITYFQVLIPRYDVR